MKVSLKLIEKLIVIEIIMNSYDQLKLGVVGHAGVETVKYQINSNFHETSENIEDFLNNLITLLPIGYWLY